MYPNYQELTSAPRLVLPLTLLLLFFACGGERTATTTEVLPSGQYADWFDPATATAVSDLKQQFDDGLLAHGGGATDIPYLYEQNALRLRMHFLEEESFSFLFPFNGKMSLSEEEELAGRIGFMSYDCGYQPARDTIVNFFCPAADSTYFAYLANVQPNSILIDRFRESYLADRVITPSMRQAMLTSAREELDFSSPDHQLFYALFHLWVLDDMQARVAAQRIANEQRETPEEDG